MNFRFPIGMLLAASFLISLTGCYNDRWTGNYDEIPELNSNHTAVLEKNELSQKDREKQHEILRAVIKAERPCYTINGGDKIDVKVYNHPDLSVKTVVTPDGYLGLTLIGEIKVSGLTLGQASKKIADALSKYIRNPKVGLSPYEIVSETASISGAVMHPGMYTVTNGMRLADLFAKAGGAASRYYDGQTLSAADFTTSLFIRNNKVVPVDFIKAIEHGDPLHNIPLYRGDYIYIAARENSQVYLVGEVKKPGRHVWNPQLGLLELLSDGGWMNDVHWKNVILIRGGLNDPKMYKIDIDGIMRGKHPNIALKSGDIVYVPKDNISEYNVFIHKLIPTAQLINMMITPAAWMSSNVL